MMQSAGIVVNDVTVTWRNGHTALRDASFTVPGGSIAALVGVNGSGKSTLFKAIMGFVRLTSGKISVLGIPTRQALQKNLVAYVPQSEEVDWSFPVLVMLVVPLGIVGVLLAATLFNQKNDVYFMVGLLTTIGLSAKNAILIVEFAKDLMEKEGKGVVEATLMAVRMRLRPILMTSLAFILGVLPLAISNGAGSGAQNAVGIGVMGGMVSATLLAIFFVPVFFVVIRRCFKG